MKKIIDVEDDEILDQINANLYLRKDRNISSLPVLVSPSNRLKPAAKLNTGMIPGSKFPLPKPPKLPEKLHVQGRSDQLENIQKSVSMPSVINQIDEDKSLWLKEQIIEQEQQRIKMLEVEKQLLQVQLSKFDAIKQAHAIMDPQTFYQFFADNFK